MKINNEFTVSAPVGKAWDVMLDLEKVAPCLPGASIQESTGDGEYKGTMKVKIGPITATYKGTVKIEESDDSAHRAVIKATGRDARGQGTASATIVSKMEDQGDKTKVNVETDMHLTGRAAQFGRGIAQDVASKMLGQFAECLEEELAGHHHEPAAEATPSSTPSGAAGSAGNGTTAQPTGTPLGGMGGGLGNVVSAEPGTTVAGGTVAGSVVSGAGSQEAAASTPPTTTAQPGAQQRPRREPEEHFDLGAASQEAILKRAAPVLIGVGVIAVLIWLIRRR